MEEIIKIDEYLKSLKEYLEQRGIKTNKIILDDIKDKMYSLIALWEDRNLRNGILFFAKEIAEFYEPNANIGIKSFVVSTVRNSYLESAGSEFYQNYYFENQLTDEDMPKITGFAINFFKKFDFVKASKELMGKVNDNYYLKIIQKYPLAWKVIERLANLKTSEAYFDKIPLKTDLLNLRTIGGFKPKTNKKGQIIEDGNSLAFNTELLKQLEDIAQAKGVFFTNSFKTLSRNFEKVLKTIEYLLQRDCIYVTMNYYISNGYVSCRKKLMPPQHASKSVAINFNDISKKHKKVLESLKKQGVLL